MQIDMTGVLDTASTLRRSTEVEKNTLEFELEEKTKSFTEAMNILKSMLVVVGVSNCQFDCSVAYCFICLDHGGGDVEAE